MSKLNPNAQKWVDALRSGKYRQARNFLRSDDSFCCLGVACEISGLGAWSEDAYLINEWGGNKLLPGQVQKWLGLKDSVGCIVDNGEDTHLAWMNDHGSTFEQIADLIEAHAEELGVSA